MIKRLEKKIRKRQKNLKRGDIYKASAIEKELSIFGIELTDSKHGTQWKNNHASTPKNPPSSNLTLKFSLSQPVILPQ